MEPHTSDRWFNLIYLSLSVSVSLYRSDRTVHYVSIELTDPDFTHGSLFDDGVARLRYHVPLQYPLLPCYIDIENKGVSKSISR